MIVKIKLVFVTLMMASALWAVSYTEVFANRINVKKYVEDPFASEEDRERKFLNKVNPDGTLKYPDVWYKKGARYYYGLDGEGINFRKAYEYWTPPAKEGHKEATYGMGLLRFNGRGITKDYGGAMHWFLKAHEAGHPEAAYYLGVIHFEGTDVEKKDYDKAREWFEKGVKSGDQRAAYALGLLYYNGNGVEQSYENAHILWQQIAERGNSEAQYSLGTMYETGQGVEQNMEEALRWYKMAKEQGHLEAHRAYNELSQ